MPPPKRYYSEDDPEIGVTPAQLKRLKKADQLEYMRFWFHSNFVDPAEETPYESAEGGYLYVWGGPYETSDELHTEFGEIVSQKRIDDAVADLESNGTFEWAPGPHHPDMQRRADEWEDDQGTS